MEVSLTFDPDEPGPFYMAVASEATWRELLRNLDGIGHSPAALNLINGLKGWGVTK